MSAHDSTEGGYALAYGTCLACRTTFGFNPLRVPSLTVDGDRKPVCSNCMGLVNQKRKKMGLPPHPVLPGAYDPAPISEL